MNSSSKSNWQIRLAVLIIFIIGFVAGALTMNIYRGRIRPSSPAMMRDRFEHVLDKLDLTPDQRTQVRAILDDARAQLTEIRKQSQPRFHEVRKQTDVRLQAVLTPEQWQQFQQMMGEFKDQRRRHRDKRDGRP